MNPRFVALSLAGLICLAPAARAQKVKIEVHAGWQGLAPTRHSKFVITGADGKYKGGGKPMDSSAVEAFLSAVREPPSPAISADVCGLNDGWIAANKDRALGLMFRISPQKTSPAQAELFRTQFTVAKVQEYLDSFKHTIVRDDDTDIEVRVTVDGAVTIIHTGSSLQFLLPWQDTENEHRNFNCRISTSLGALLPPTFLDQPRLVPDSPQFLRQVAQYVVRDNVAQWDSLGPPLYRR